MPAQIYSAQTAQASFSVTVSECEGGKIATCKLYDYEQTVAAEQTVRGKTTEAVVLLSMWAVYADYATQLAARTRKEFIAGSPPTSIKWSLLAGPELDFSPIITSGSIESTVAFDHFAITCRELMRRLMTERLNALVPSAPFSAAHQLTLRMVGPKR